MALADENINGTLLEETKGIKEFIPYFCIPGRRDGFLFPPFL
jgi:hypothetical protein